MKQIIAVVRDERIEETKKALRAIGVRGVTFLYVTGRGHRIGNVSAGVPGGGLNRTMRLPRAHAPPGEGTPDTHPGAETRPPDRDTESASGFLPKRMLVIISGDEEVDGIVQALVQANQTGRHGDGRIFICPMISAIRVRTGEQGEKALS
jgi:nitrogen regulatory protein PII 2